MQEPRETRSAVRGAPRRFGPDNVLRAMRAAETGEVISLNADLSDPVSPFGRPPFTRTARLHNQVRPIGDGRYVVVNDDEVSFALQGSSQWDSFAHVGLIDPTDEGVYLDGAGLEETYPEPRARHLGIQALGPGIVARGVLVDVVAHLDPRHGFLDHDIAITRETVEACLERQKTDVLPGDAVLIYTGFERRRASLGGAYPSAASGVVADTVPLWEEMDILALASDNPGVEKTPADYSVHLGMLRRLGVPLGELWALEELAMRCRTHGRYSFCLASVPLNIPGAFGSTANAIAIM